MENKIKAGEYIRTYEGIIGKVLEDEDIAENGVYIDTTFFDDYADETNFVKYEDIKSHSFNIIDLIEEGDYVNGNEIALEAPNPDPLCDPIYGYFDRYGELVGIIENEDIKSIVTKEQFKSVEYAKGSRFF